MSTSSNDSFIVSSLDKDYKALTRTWMLVGAAV